KRDREEDDSKPSKKQKKGFSVGPQNLPDGTYKRKVQKIKRNLIEKAKIKKEYAKVRARELDDGQSNANPPESASPKPEPTLEPHPDRAALLNRSASASPAPETEQPRARERRQRTNPYTKQLSRAEKLKQEAEQWRKEREEAQLERERKLQDRERWRRQMAKARQPGKDGKRKLGRESKMLYEKVKRMV
ncbi:hypothetical protein NA57DRAFT_10159, partial [Rhizodiscina lignyota]